MTGDTTLVSHPRKLKRRPRQVSIPLDPSGRDRCSSAMSSGSKRLPFAHHPAPSHYTIRATPPRSILRRESLELKDNRFRPSAGEYNLKPPKPTRHVSFDLDDDEKPRFRSRSTPPAYRSHSSPYEGRNLTELDPILGHSPPLETERDGPTCDWHQEIISRRRNGRRKTYNFMLHPEYYEDRSRSLPRSPSRTESYPHELRERTQSTPPSLWVSNAITAISREEREQMSGSGTLAQLKRSYSKSSSLEEDLPDRQRIQHNPKRKISVAHLWFWRKPKPSALTTTMT